MRTQAPSLFLSDDQFLDWAERQEHHFELVEGAVMMQAGATRDHERVAKRVFSSLLRQVDEAAFDVNKGDFGVRIKQGRGAGTILYPDVVVDQQSLAGDERATTTPVVIGEVLSRSTDFDEHVRKLGLYEVRATLRHYVVFDQKRPLVHLWSCRLGVWPDSPTDITGLDGPVALEAIGATLDLAEIYRPL